MTQPTTEVAFTPSVKAEQERRGSRRAYAKLEAKGGWAGTVTAELAAVIAEVRSFYLATVNADGQPYIQHRGGPPGFLCVLDHRTLGFADFSGNRQYITTGNLADNPRAFIFLMDYVNRRRVKIWGRARVVADDPHLVARLMPEGYKARPEQAILFAIAAWDVNCQQHIPHLLPAESVAAVIDTLRGQVRELEDQIAKLKARRD